MSPTDPGFDRRVDEIFSRLLDAAEAEREGLLRHECGGDADLEREVRLLLEAAERQSAGDTETWMRPVTWLAADGSPPERVGAFEVLREIGRGGMGVVYLAERTDGTYEQKVALKVLHEASQERERFVHERQILAQLDHPGIARILDGGVLDDGRPYFAMEYVVGRTIERYAEEERLDLEARLQLVLDLCGAVDAAHRALVVHRDIKPSNVLIDEERRVRLLDFGIAKSLGVEGELTKTGHRAMTPQYASPEQYLGQAVTVASDVYQLGLLAYELVARKRPYELGGTTPVESVRLVCEQVPQPPSMARVEGAAPLDISPDLDLVLMKALHKDPERRYTTAASFADDLRRFLQSEPVTARPDSLLYRARLFARRNVAAVSMALLMLATLLGSGWWYLHQIGVERRATEAAAELAEEQRDRARQTVSFLIDIFGDVDPIFGTDPNATVREIVERSAARLEGDFSGSAHDRASLLDALSVIERRQGMLDVSIAHGRTALELVRNEEGHAGSDEVIRFALNLSRSLHAAGGSEEAKEVLEGVVPDPDLSSVRDPDLRATYFAELSKPVARLGDLEAAEELLLAALEEPGGPRPVVRTLLGNVYRIQGRYEEAVTQAELALEGRKQELGETHPMVGDTHRELGVVLIEAGRPAEAIPHLERSQEMALGRFEGDHRMLANSLSVLGVAYYESDRLVEAERVHRESLAMMRRLAMPELGPGLSNLANTLFKADRSSREAVDLHRAALASFEAHDGERHWNVGMALNNLGEVLEAQGAVVEARTALERADSIFREVFGDAHPFVSHPLVTLARLAVREGDLATAQHLYAEALRIREGTYGPDAPETQEVRVAMSDLEAQPSP